MFRVPLDRAFSAKGFGAVVAGIPVAGAATLGDELVLLPQNARGRVKRIEVYGHDSDTVRAGQCAAINLGHCDAKEVGRGDVLTLPDYFAPSEWYLARLRLLPGETVKLKNGSEVRFHTGTSDVSATLYFLDREEPRAGSEHTIQVRVHRPVVAGPGDAFILRALSPVRTVGGGTIIEAEERRLNRNRPGLLDDLAARHAAVGQDAAFVEYSVRHAPKLVIGEVEIARRAKVLRPRLQEVLGELIRGQKVLAAGGALYLHRQTADEAGSALCRLLTEHHRQSPESPGMTIEQVRQATAWEKPVLDAVLALLKTAGRIAERNQRLALAEHRPVFQDEDAARLTAIEELYQRQPFSPPSAEEAARTLSLTPQIMNRLLGALKEHQRLIDVGEGMLFHADAVARARQLLVEHIQKEGRLESVQFKYLVETTRKFALPLLDYFDRVGLLRRAGNTRYLKAR